MRIKVIGCGATARIIAGQWGLTQKEMIAVAIKQMQENDPEAEQKIRREIKYLKQLQHPNIVKFYHAQKNKKHIEIIMELCECSLRDVIQAASTPDKQKCGLQIEQVKNFTADIVAGLRYLHKSGIIHRDIKPDNILLNNGVCKLSDFGDCVLHQSQSSKFQALQENPKDDPGLSRMESSEVIHGTNFYLDPATMLDMSRQWNIHTPGNPDADDADINLKPEPYTKMSDIWSVGVTVFEMITGNHLWANCKEAKKYFSKLAGANEEVLPIFYTDFLPAVAKGEIPVPQVPLNYDQQARNFVECCLKVNRYDRKTANELYKHPFLKEVYAERKFQKKLELQKQEEEKELQEQQEKQLQYQLQQQQYLEQLQQQIQQQQLNNYNFNITYNGFENVEDEIGNYRYDNPYFENFNENYYPGMQNNINNYFNASNHPNKNANLSPTPNPIKTKKQAFSPIYGPEDEMESGPSNFLLGEKDIFTK